MTLWVQLPHLPAPALCAMAAHSGVLGRARPAAPEAFESWEHDALMVLAYAGAECVPGPVKVTLMLPRGLGPVVQTATISTVLDLIVRQRFVETTATIADLCVRETDGREIGLLVEGFQRAVDREAEGPASVVSS